jgi:hypothetical protein
MSSFGGFGGFGQNNQQQQNTGFSGFGQAANTNTGRSTFFTPSAHLARSTREASEQYGNQHESMAYSSRLFSVQALVLQATPASEARTQLVGDFSAVVPVDLEGLEVCRLCFTALDTYTGFDTTCCYLKSSMPLPTCHPRLLRVPLRIFMRQFIAAIMKQSLHRPPSVSLSPKSTFTWQIKPRTST